MHVRSDHHETTSRPRRRAGRTRALREAARRLGQGRRRGLRLTVHRGRRLRRLRRYAHEGAGGDLLLAPAALRQVPEGYAPHGPDRGRQVPGPGVALVHATGGTVMRGKSEAVAGARLCPDARRRQARGGRMALRRFPQHTRPAHRPRRALVLDLGDHGPAVEGLRTRGRTAHERRDAERTQGPHRRRRHRRTGGRDGAATRRDRGRRLRGVRGRRGRGRRLPHLRQQRPGRPARHRRPPPRALQRLPHAAHGDPERHRQAPRGRSPTAGRCQTARSARPSSGPTSTGRCATRPSGAASESSTASGSWMPRLPRTAGSRRASRTVPRPRETS